MNLKQKLTVLAGIPILGLLILAGIGWLNLNQQTEMTETLISDQFVPLVEQDIAELNRLQASIKTLLEADRDAYQTMVAEMSILQAAPGADTEKQRASHKENMQQVEDRLAKASKAFDPAMMTKYQTFQNQFKQWRESTNKVITLAVSEATRDQALQQSAGATRQAFGAMRDTIDQLSQMLDEKIATTMAAVDAKKKAATDLGKQSQNKANYSILLFLIITAIVTLISIATTVLMTISITKPIRLVVDGLDAGADQLASASGEVSTSSQSLAQGTSEQAASLEETSSSMEEMASMTKKNADNANQADGMMKEAGHIVAEAVQAMHELRSAMDKINAASGETAKIIKTIDEIAFQTNLLALNAAVEAARAGEAGAGFAVVADEVRALALRAAEAAQNTSELIEQNISNIKVGTDLVINTDEVFVQVQESAAKVAELVGEISAASSEQSQGIDQVNLAMGQMDGVTQQIAANAEQAAAASEELSAQSSTLQGYVEQLSKVLGRKQAVQKPIAQSNDTKSHAQRTKKVMKPLPMPQSQADGTVADFEDF